MGHEIPTVTAGSGAGFVTNAKVRNESDDGGELTLHPGCQNWTVAQYKVDNPTSFDARRFYAIFYAGRRKAMFDQWGTRRDTDMGAWERCCNVIKSWCPGYIITISPFGMPFVRHDHKLDYLRNLRQAIARVCYFQRMSDFALITFKRLCNRLYLVHNAPDWWQELDFEGRYRRGSHHLRFLGDTT